MERKAVVCRWGCVEQGQGLILEEKKKKRKIIDLETDIIRFESITNIKAAFL